MTSGVRFTSPRRSPNHATGRAFVAGAVAAALMAIAPPANAQTTTGNIRGYVRGPNNTPVPDAQVAARNPAMGTEPRHRLQRERLLHTRRTSARRLRAHGAAHRVHAADAQR